MRKCPFCNRNYPSGRSFGAHLTNCIKNPNREKRIQKIKETNKNKWKEFIVSCHICKKEISIKEYNTDKPKKEKYYCSRSCANNRGPRSEETKRKIAKGNTKINKKKYYCNNCGKELSRKRKTNLCSKCLHSSIEYRTKISKSCKGKNAGNKNGMYGKSPKNTKNIKVFSKKHTGNKIFAVRSSYEKIFVDKINENELISKFTYEPKEFKVKYKDKQGIERTYQPDFLVEDNQIREIKNKWNAELEETKLKENAFRTKFPYIDYKIIAW